MSACCTPEKLAELSATTVQNETNKLLDSGVGNPPDKDWKSKAKPLPTDGGAAGAAFVAQINAMAAAAKANDVDAMMSADDSARAKLIFGATRWDGKPVSLRKRQLGMRAQVVRMLTDAKVVGGYQLDNRAALIFEGHDGNGWIVRGCQLMEFAAGAWSPAGREDVSIPPA